MVLLARNQHTRSPRLAQSIWDEWVSEERGKRQNALMVLLGSSGRIADPSIADARDQI